MYRSINKLYFCLYIDLLKHENTKGLTVTMATAKTIVLLLFSYLLASCCIYTSRTATVCSCHDGMGH